jgi:hypothetical protein
MALPLHQPLGCLSWHHPYHPVLSVPVALEPL